MNDATLSKILSARLPSWEMDAIALEEFVRINCEMTELWIELEQNVNSEVLDLFSRYISLNADMFAILQDDRFDAGFSMGAHLQMAAIREGSSDIITIKSNPKTRRYIIQAIPQKQEGCSK